MRWFLLAVLATLAVLAASSGGAGRPAYDDGPRLSDRHLELSGPCVLRPHAGLPIAKASRLREAPPRASRTATRLGSVLLTASLHRGAATGAPVPRASRQAGLAPSRARARSMVFLS